MGPDELPQNIEELFDSSGCPTCAAAAAAHFGTTPHTLVVDGGDGFNAVGDSILFFHGQTAQIEVTADPDTTLTFLCIIHPWMQGTIEVT